MDLKKSSDLTILQILRAPGARSPGDLATLKPTDHKIWIQNEKSELDKHPFEAFTLTYFVVLLQFLVKGLREMSEMEWQPY